MGFGFSSLGFVSYGFGNNQLIWTQSTGAISYNIYHGFTAGLSTAHSTILDNTEDLFFDLNDLPVGANYYIVAAVGPNGELSGPSNEIAVTG